MRVALLADDPGTQAIVAALLKRLEVETDVRRVPASARRHDQDLLDLVASLHQHYDEVVVVAERPDPIPGALVLAPHPSIEAWLTADPAALEAAFGQAGVPPPSPTEAKQWLEERVYSLHGGRGYSAAIDGVQLAASLDPARLAEISLEFRALAARLSPTWATGKAVKLPRGRPPGVSMFRGSGYTFCLELLRHGEGAEIRPTELVKSVERTKTPISRLVSESVRRGYLRRTTPRGPLLVRGTPRLVDDLVKDVRARAANRQLRGRGIRSTRELGWLLLQIQDRAAQWGRAFAVTGAGAVEELGGSDLVGVPARIFLGHQDLDALLAPLGLSTDERDPQLIILEPYEAGVFHAARKGRPTRVSPWQAVIDLLASDSSRERECGEAARRELETRR